MAATAVAVVVALVRDLPAGLEAAVGLAVAVALGWQGVLRTGRSRHLLFAAAAVVVAVVLFELAQADRLGEAGIVLAGTVLSVVMVRVAFGPNGAAGGAWRPVPAAERPVLLVNPRSGDGRAARADLGRHARAAGVEVLELGPGDDLEVLARSAIDEGADVIGMAGGDGSMALVASLACSHGRAFVCVPAGTRNHFALDLGVRREDLIGALRAFNDGVEATVDLATVNERVFVNNVSLGAYGEAVHDPGYRDAKAKTLGRSVAGLVGPSASAPALRVTDDQGREHEEAALILISNNAYALDRSLGRGTRPSLDGGKLGIVLVARGRGASRAWSTKDVSVQTPGTTACAVDGEAVSLESPLRFSTKPGALRVRIAADHPGVSPSGRLPPSLRVVVPRLLQLAAGD